MISKYAIPQTVMFVEHLERTSVGKIDKKLLRQLYTRIYFADEVANAADPLLTAIEDETARQSLIARRGPDGAYRFDIVLQGNGETAFLDI